MVSNSAKLDHRTKQHTQFGVSASNGSRDMGRTKSWRKKKEKKEKRKMNIDSPIKYPLRGSLMMPAEKDKPNSLVKLGLHPEKNIIPMNLVSKEAQFYVD